MKVTYNWLKQYVDFDWSPEELAERLTMLGLETESMEQLGGGFDGIVVAEVITRDKHPNADKLSLCRVNDGQGERQIVCGAHNFEGGNKVPVILPGASLPLKEGDTKPLTIKVGKIRGCESQGMICSHQELGIDPESIGLKAEEHGILVLKDDARVGQPFAEYLGQADKDVLYDLEITPNRPDWNSVIGIAREIAALTGNALRLPEVRSPKSEVQASDLVNVRIEDEDLCPRYTARVVQGVKIGPSPDWLRTALEKVGIRSISNVVDVTNFVMMETGQPLHAFDYHLISRPTVEQASSPFSNSTPVGQDPSATSETSQGTTESEMTGKMPVLPPKVEQASSLSPQSESKSDDRQAACPTIVVRRAKDGEKFTTLDEQEHELTSENLLIADEEKGIALAGVMGGLNTEINDQTQDVLLESAYFSPTNIRRTSKALGLRTDSSYRFERGADIGIADWASQRAAQLILETAGGQLADGVVDAYPKPAETRQITLRHRKVTELLGITLKPEEIEYYLGQLGLKKPSAQPSPKPVEADAAPEPVTFEIPSFRVDLKREVDLIEEVCRLHGVDKIPATPPRGAHGENEFDAVYDQIAEARRILTGLGLNEAQGQTLIAKSEVRSAKSEDIVELANPLSADMDVLRPSLLPGLIHSLRHNVSHKNHNVALFEIGRVFRKCAAGGSPADQTKQGATKQTEGDKFNETRRVAIALTGQRSVAFWSGADRDAKFDTYDIKGLLDEFLEQFGLRGVMFTRRDEPTELFFDSATIKLGGKLPLGELGLLQPALAKQYDLRDPVLLAELDLDQMLRRRNAGRSFKAIPQFPSIRRDVAMFIPEDTTHASVLAAARKAKAENLESVEVFDVFRGKNVPEGHKSVAYAFTYRAPDRTLRDKEVNNAHEKLVEALRATLKAVVRE